MQMKISPMTMVVALISMIGAWAINALLLGLIVMLLWNWLVPSIFASFHLHEITYIQGWGLAFLASIFFKGK